MCTTWESKLYFLFFYHYKSLLFYLSYCIIKYSHCLFSRPIMYICRQFTYHLSLGQLRSKDKQLTYVVNDLIVQKSVGLC